MSAARSAEARAGQFSAVQLIRTKRDGGRLSGDQIGWLIDAFTRGAVAPEQMSAMAMAIVFRGLDEQELSDWTTAMINSGERLDLSRLDRPTVDKHSTGGVGDKITLPLVPLLAACGAAVPQLSGRGLGHTGGTLDKLESIPGWRADLDAGAMIEQLRRIGAVICAAGPGLAPADRLLYALRDVTGTVESVDLIASSIMSKKIAEGTASLVLDVKVGRGAFMTELAPARRLAELMVGLGERAGVATVALLTRMDAPMGRAVGNALEVAEALEVLAGGGPADVVQLTLTLAREMVALAGLDADPAQLLADGHAMDAWRAMIRAQGGDPTAALPVARLSHEVTAAGSGYLAGLDALAIGTASWLLGAGRARKEDPVQPAAGIELLVGPGEPVRRGQAVLRLHAQTPAAVESALEVLDAAVSISARPPSLPELVIERIG